MDEKQRGVGKGKNEGVRVKADRTNEEWTRKVRTQQNACRLYEKLPS